MNVSQKKYHRFGCIIAVIAGLIFVVAEVLHFVGLVRVPIEIPIDALLEAQSEALGAEWHSRPVSDMYTDTDFTSAAWMYWTRFDHTDWPYYLKQELHVYRSPARAISRFAPPPLAVNVDQSGNQPPGWNYTPPHADRFVLGCTPEPVPERCDIRLVYEEYSFVISVYLAGAMSLADLQRFLQTTDDFMAEFLSTTKLERGRRQVPTPEELRLPEDS